MQTIAVLLQDYRGKLQAAAAITPNEQRLCSLLTQELANLENAVEAPCRTVRMLAQAYAEDEGFPAVLRLA